MTREQWAENMDQATVVEDVLAANLGVASSIATETVMLYSLHL